MFIWRPSHLGVRGYQLAYAAAKEMTIVKHVGVCNHYDSAKASIRRAIEEPLLLVSVYFASTAKK